MRALAIFCLGLAATPALAADYVAIRKEVTVARPADAVWARVGDYWRAGFPDARWAVEDAFGAGDRAAVRWRMTGRHQAPFEGVPPTNREVDLTGILIVRVEGDRIAEIWHAEDVLGVMIRIGAKPEASEAG